MLRHFSLRFQVGILLLGISLFSILFIFINSRYNADEMNLSHYHQDISRVKAMIYKSVNLENEFIFSESQTNQFHITGTSPSLREFDENIRQLMLTTRSIQKHSLTNQFHLSEELIDLRDKIIHHALILKDLKENTLKMGFFNYGLEGELRFYIHELEDNYIDIIPLSEILQLRRTEKDFMLRHDFTYYNENKKLQEKIKKTIRNNASSVKHQKADVLLKNYGNKLTIYASLDTVIGLTSEQGIRKKIKENSNALLGRLDAIVDQLNSKGNVYLSQINRLSIISLCIFLFLLIVIIYYTSRHVAKPIRELSNKIHTFIHSGYEQKINLEDKKRGDEIGQLIRHMHTLQIEITEHFAQFKEESEKKQKKLEEQKEKIEIQTFLMRESRNSLKEQIQYYSDGIQYANRIQQSILPKESKIKSIFGEIGLHYNPKDIVSGDFYWIYENERYKFMAIADCTGHGVPGAFMSILGISYLNYGVRDKAISETGELLNYLNSKVAEVLGQYGENSEVKDGMDISLIRVDKNSGQLSYSGAQQELIVIRGGEFVTMNPDRFPIGWILPGAKKQFNTQYIDLEPNDLLILYTDGTVDQFGGPKNKKYKRKQFYDLLRESRHLPPETISKLLGNSLRNWQGANEQTDDICCIILKHEMNKVHSNYEDLLDTFIPQQHPSFFFDRHINVTLS